MSVAFRFDFPPDVLEERDKVFQEIEELLLLRTVDAAEKAVALHRAWVERYPDDYIALDAGSHLLMLYDAIIATEQSPSAKVMAEAQPAVIG